MEIQKDIGAEILERLHDILRWIERAKEKLAEKDKKIAELENKIKESK